jgi:predicted component of viral defense system (DUF524 family)
LYEVWTYFAVVRAVGAILGRDPTIAQRPSSNDVQVELPWGLKVSWGRAIDVLYNLAFNRSRTDVRRSMSLSLRPDIVVHVRGEAGDALHALDAKLRVAVLGSNEIEDERAPIGFRHDDLAKMHAYRDALPHVRSAFVLYPGEISRAFPALDGAPGSVDAVGAIALSPGGPTDDLIAHLRRVLQEGRAA